VRQIGTTGNLGMGGARELPVGPVTHLAFYVGWPNAMSALPVFKDVFATRLR
jgi:4-carboxymuconolactone decarboxylase